MLGVLFLELSGASAQVIKLGGACGERCGGDVFRGELGDLRSGLGIGGDLLLYGIKRFRFAFRSLRVN